MSKKLNDQIANVREHIQDQLRQERFHSAWSGSPGLGEITFNHETDLDRTFAAKQQFKDDCDVNFIVRNHVRNGTLKQLVEADPRAFLDVSEVPDYQNALEIIRESGEQFALLPATVREKFSNDPAQFLEFAGNPANLREMVHMGLATEEVLENAPIAPSTASKEVVLEPTSGKNKAPAGNPAGADKP
nr:MAG: internal scaffolding protein [Microvirus sp.]